MPRGPKFSIVVFLNALCLGTVSPLLYYIIELPDSIWIGLLFAVHSVARIAGRPLLDRFEGRWGLPRELAFGQMIGAVGYGLLAVAGGTNLPHRYAMDLIYMAVFLVGCATANIPSPVSLTRDMGGSLKSRGTVAAIGTAVGCAISAVFAPWLLADNIMPVRDLFYAGLAAAGCSLIASIIAWKQPTTDMAPHPALRRRSEPAWLSIVTLSAEAALFMGICSSPLMQWETYWFHPGPMALFFSVLAVISISASRWRMPEKPAIQLGLLFSATGFLGFTTALWLSWVNHPFNGMHIGPWVIWISTLPAGIGHGLLRSGLRDRGSAKLDRWGAVAIGAAALFATRIWAVHERDSIAIPGVILAAAGMLALLKWPHGQKSTPPLPSGTDP